MTYIKGHKHTEETLKKIRKALKGRKPWNKLKRTTRKCPICNKVYVVPVKKSVGAGYRKFCSLLCRYTDRLDKKPWNKNIKTGIIPKTVFKKGCKPWNKGLTKNDQRIRKMVETRRKTDGYRHSKKTIDKIKKKRTKQKFPFNNTKIEVILQKELKKENIKFRTHRYDLPGTPDIFIEPNICIFADGDYWHSKKEQIEKDKINNKKLKEMNYVVLRFWEHEILLKTNKCVKKIRIAIYGQRKNL